MYLNRRFINISTIPFDDDKAKYEDHRYIVVEDYFKDKTGIDLETELGGVTPVNVFLDETSEALYDMIYSSANLEYMEDNIRIKEYLSAKDHNIRDRLIKALVVYARACIVSDIDKIGDETGIDFEKATKIEIKEWDDLPLQTQRKLIATDLMFEGRYNYMVDPAKYRSDY